MHGLTLPTAMPIVIAMTLSSIHVDGFSNPPAPHCAIDARVAHTMNAKAEVTTALFGILDDIMDEENADDGEQNNNDNEQLVDLYHSLIFSGDLQSAISKRLDECSDPSFLEYLTVSLDSSEDDEERQGLADLIGQIDEVKALVAKKAADEEKQAALAAKALSEFEKEAETEAAANAVSSKSMSNADILRKANEIDAAIALSDEEKPSDFISDCREVVNLSRGFNDSGQMRVGGQ
mmetsp:Transcript_19007/g.39049  ORF Transcript_19007/g.39049 Transcript_19007/m.39049 type:complete len:235 (+) Transcript_19007:91-795(+)